MTLKRKPVELVEIDVGTCPLTYGSNPCAAVLGTTGVRKCYNTRATCQDTAHYGNPAEPAGGPDRTYAQGDTLTQADFSVNANFSWACDLVLPPSPADGVIWELGGSGLGAYVGIDGSAGTLIFRVGDGTAGDPSGGARIDADISELWGSAGTLYGAVNFGTKTIELRFWDRGRQVFHDLGSRTAAGTFTVWSGTDDGACGEVNNSVVAGVPTDDYPANGIQALRVYDATLYTPTAPEVVTTLRFGRNQSGLPLTDPPVFPALASADTVPTRVNLSGINERDGPLGRREKITVTLQDFAFSDIGVDRYALERRDGTAQTDEGGYRPERRGTFLAKLRRRWPYYEGAALRRLHGSVGDAPGAMRAQHYVITGWNGPDAAGRVQIEAKDILSLADDDRALCPRPSRGKLDRDISAGGLDDFTLEPEGIGGEYPESGRICIGSEIVTYTRSGDDVQLTARGVDGTETAAHSQGDLAQECFHVARRRIDLVAADLLRDYAGIDASWLPTADWATEAERWLAGFDLTATIAKPEGVAQLIGELSQHGVMWWWDPTAQEIRMRANRPVDLGESAAEITDAEHVVAGSLQSRDMVRERLSQVILWHGMIDRAGSARDGANFRAANVSIDPEAEQALEYGQPKVREIYSRWLGAGDVSVASAVASRLLNRYRDPPREVTFHVDAKDVATLEVAALIEMSTRALLDETGAAEPVEMQVTSVEEIEAGHRIKVVAQSFDFAGRYGFITENGRADYGASSDVERAKGTYIVPASGVFADGTGPYIIF